MPAVPGSHRGSTHDRDLSRGVSGRSRRTVRITPPLAGTAGGAQGVWLGRDRALLAWVSQTARRFLDHSRHVTAAGSHRTNGPRGRASAEVPFRRDSRKPDPPQRRRFPGHAALDARTLSIIRVYVRGSTQYPLASCLQQYKGLITSPRIAGIGCCGRLLSDDRLQFPGLRRRWEARVRRIETRHVGL